MNLYRGVEQVELAKASRVSLRTLFNNAPGDSRKRVFAPPLRFLNRRSPVRTWSGIPPSLFAAS